MRLITDEQHAALVDAIERYQVKRQDFERFEETLATLQALPELEVVGKVNDTTSTDFLVEFNKLIRIDTPLYATKEPS